MIKENNTSKKELSTTVDKKIDLLRKERLNLLFKIRPWRSARWLQNAARKFALLDDFQTLLENSIDKPEDTFDNYRPIGFASGWGDVSAIGIEYPEEDTLNDEEFFY